MEALFLVPREGNAPSTYPYQGYVILFNYPGINYFGVLYEDRTHTPSATNLCAVHYTNSTINHIETHYASTASNVVY